MRRSAGILDMGRMDSSNVRRMFDTSRADKANGAPRAVSETKFTVDHGEELVVNCAAFLGREKIAQRESNMRQMQCLHVSCE